MGNNRDKKMLFEAMHKVGGMPLNEGVYDSPQEQKRQEENGKIKIHEGAEWDDQRGPDAPDAEKTPTYQKYVEMIKTQGDILRNTSKKIHEAISEFQQLTKKIEMDVRNIENKEGISRREAAILLRLILDDANNYWNNEGYGIYTEPGDIMRNSIYKGILDDTIN